jgi:hypothetical protein
MKEEARQTAAREADLPAIFHKTWQAENLAFLLGRTRQMSACHWNSPSGLPRNCGAPFCTLPESLTNFRALCGFMSFVWVYVGWGWEKKEVDGKMMGTKIF